MYLDEDGERHPIVMGSYGIGLGRNVACIVEAHHDEKGIAWPAEVAPYPAHLVALGANREPKVTEVAEALYAAAAAGGDEREILFDDRDESPGVKLTDAEMLGMPWILTVSPRSLAAGGVEVTERATGERAVPLDRGRDGVPRGPGDDAGLTARPEASSRWRARWSPRTTCTRASRWRSTPRPRRSSSPGGPCSSSTTRTSRATRSPPSSARSGSTSPTTG